MNTPARIATIGTFDGVHSGHRALIEKVHALAGGARPLVISFRVSPAAVISGESPRLLGTADERRRAIEALGADVVLLDFAAVRDLDAAAFLRRLRDMGVGTLVMGFNNHIGHDRLDADAAAALGIIPVINAGTFADGGTVSSSAVRAALADGDMAKAAAMLGRYYSVGGTVVAGRQLGRRLGFPTANIEPADSGVVLPPDGAYAAVVSVDGRDYPAMVNVGTRPTVDTGTRRFIEAHLFDFDADIYGMPVEVAFVRRLRPERRFDSLDALAAQLAADRKSAFEVLSNIKSTSTP